MTIVFATDGSAAAGSAQQFLGALPLPAGTSIQVITVISELAWRETDWVREAERRWGSRVAEQARAALARNGVEVTSAVRSGSVAGEILRAAEEARADLLVVGSEGLTGMAGFLLGSVARNVAHHALCPVLVARAPRAGLRQVILAVDESDHAAHAAASLGRLPLPAETEIVVAHVSRTCITPSIEAGMEYSDRLAEWADTERRRLRQGAEALVNRFVAELAVVGKTTAPVLREGDPAATILQLASDREADLIVAGARGVSGLRRLVVGSVADRLLTTAGCSVLIVR
jgi:nucleotide-binding universal stress UspA family protein